MRERRINPEGICVFVRFFFLLLSNDSSRRETSRYLPRMESMAGLICIICDVHAEATACAAIGLHDAAIPTWALPGQEQGHLIILRRHPQLLDCYHHSFARYDEPFQPGRDRRLSRLGINLE